MKQAVALERVGERADDVLLAGELGEGAWPPLAGKRLIAHGLGDGALVRGTSDRKGWRAVPPALAENRCGCFLPDLTRFTTVQCGATRR